MRILAMAGVALMPSTAFALDMIDGLAEKLDAKRIIDIQHSKTPPPEAPLLAVRFVRNGDSAPTCGLIQKNGKYVDLVSPEPGQSLPACAAPLKAPVFFSSKSHYVVYEYQTEDPKHTITQTFQLFRMANDEITKCKNDDQLTDAAQKTTKTQGVALSFKNAVMNLGCKQ